jgi:hypothetical protein
LEEGDEVHLEEFQDSDGLAKSDVGFLRPTPDGEEKLPSKLVCGSVHVAIEATNGASARSNSQSHTLFPEESRHYLGFGGNVFLSPVGVPFVHHFVDENLQPTPPLDAGVQLDYSARPPQPVCPVPAELALHDFGQFGLAHLRMR